MDVIHWVAILLALYALYVLIALVLDCVRLCRARILKQQLKRPLLVLKGTSLVQTTVRVLLLTLGIMCAYGLKFGYSTTPGALFEKPRYTIYYDGYANLDKASNSYNVIVQITHDGGYYIDNVYFIPGGAMNQIDSDKIENSEYLFNDIKIRDPVSGLKDCFWNIKLTKPSKKDVLNSIDYQPISTEKWVEIVNNNTDICYICQSISYKEDGSYYKFSTSTETVFVCDNCQNENGGADAPIIKSGLSCLLSLEYSNREMSEIIADYANEQRRNGADYWDSVIPNYQFLDISCVYWTPKGKSYHSTKDCVALLNSKIINNGTLDEANAKGKADPCSKCVGD